MGIRRDLDAFLGPDLRKVYVLAVTHMDARHRVRRYGAFLIYDLLGFLVDGKGGVVEVVVALGNDQSVEHLGNVSMGRCIVGYQLGRAYLVGNVFAVDLVELDKGEPILDLPGGQDDGDVLAVGNDDVAIDQQFRTDLL